MTELKRLLSVRKAIKKKTPLFVRGDAHKGCRIRFRWRKPRGRHSPVRQAHRGRLTKVSPGYGAPQEVRGLHPSGLVPFIIKEKKELEKINPAREGVLLSHTLGNKKRIELLQLAVEKNFPLLNVKEPKKYLEKLKQDFAERKEAKKHKTSEKEKKDMEKKKAALEKEEKGKTMKKEEAPSEEKTPEELQKEKKESEKEEMEKALIKKQ